MNTNMSITCSTCEQDIDCRIGYSNRVIQPLFFACLHCGSPVEVTLDISDAPRSQFSYKGCEPAARQPAGGFDGTNPFVNLHLDFPVRAGKYEMGQTPYLIAVQEVARAVGDHETAHAMLQSHSQKLDMLSGLSEESDKVEKLIRLYRGKNKQLFQQRAAQFLDQPINKSLLPQDLTASLYLVIAKAFFPFIIFGEGKEISEGMPNFVQNLDQKKLDIFMHGLCQTSFLDDLHRDCLKIYPAILDAELPLRPALFLDLVGRSGSEKTATRVSSERFDSLKDLYKDIIEVISRQLVLVAGLNNLYHRGDADSFQSIDGGAPRGLEKFSEKALSKRFKYLDNCWFNLDESIFNLDLRNAIAHGNVHFENISQILTYVPGGGSLKVSEGKEISLLDFLGLLLNAFREMHNLNHVMKSLLYYQYLVYDRRQAERKV